MLGGRLERRLGRVASWQGVLGLEEKGGLRRKERTGLWREGKGSHLHPLPGCCGMLFRPGAVASQ